jgi:hypothetical protein
LPFAKPRLPRRSRRFRRRRPPALDKSSGRITIITIIGVIIIGTIIIGTTGIITTGADGDCRAGI